MAESEIQFNRPQTTREEAAAAERSKREAEMEELRRLRAEAKNDQSSSLSSAEAAKKKREEEMEELRRLKGGENAEFRQRLAEKGGTLTTDMDAWRSNQWGAKEADRKKKLEAQSNLAGHRAGYHGTKTAAALDKEHMTQAQREAQNNLHSHKGYYDDTKKTAAALDKEHMTQAQKDQMAAMAGLKVGDGGNEQATAANPDDYVEKERPEPERQKSIMFKDKDEEIPRPKKDTACRVSFKAGEPAPAAKSEPAAPAPAAVPERPKLPAKTQQSFETAEDNPMLKPPSFSRVDIKFSFGLIVRSSAADGFNGENLRDNETLRKCMEGTHQILLNEMAPPPDMSKMEGKSSFVSFKVKWPEAYYDPSLEPTVISIEEDKKDDGKQTAKGNKRTLVKASFPVFLRDEADDDEGAKRSARMLKETKTTVFKALRAAVSGGSFLR